MGVHDGHRERIRNRYLQTGADSLEDHELLELLLYYVVPRGDTNALAHTLLTRFGTLDGVFSAPMEELLEVDGIGKRGALLLTFLPQLFRRCEIRRAQSETVIHTSRQAGEYLLPYFRAEHGEVIYLLCLDSKHKVISCRPVTRGGIDHAALDARDVVEIALHCKASGVILAHNHTSGVALPSKADEEATRQLKAVLAAVGVELLDHIVAADGDFISMADNGFFR